MATTDIYTHMTLDEFVKAVQKHYFYRVYSLRIRTEASGIEPHTVIPYKVTVKTLSSDVFTMFGNEPYLDMEDFVHMFQGIPLITVSSDDFINDKDTLQVETWSSYINIYIIELSRCIEHRWAWMNPHKPYDVKSALLYYNEDKARKSIQKGFNMLQLYKEFRTQVKDTE